MIDDTTFTCSIGFLRLYVSLQASNLLVLLNIVRPSMHQFLNIILYLINVVLSLLLLLHFI